ncbi:MAG: twin-arginine translocase subunit TatC [candidate division KSB1 bacterium]|nr:twin-arginine translocase subunit TatC [candidate division KSB1 bacterium]
MADDKNKYDNPEEPEEQPENQNSADSEQNPEQDPYSEANDSSTDESAAGTENETGPEKKSKETKNDDDKTMPFLDHLEELRWMLLRSITSIVLAAVVCFFFSEEIVTLLKSAGPPDLKLIYLAPAEGFMTYIKVSIFAGLILALPYVAWEFWRFVVPGLLDKERKLVPPIVFFTVLCFLVGALFAFKIIIGFGLNFLLGFQTDFLEANITISKYLGFVVTLVLVFGIVFELPVLSYFLTRIGILNPEFLKKKRAYGIVTIFIIAAMVTPPDIFTQLMLAGPLILLYEISILVSEFVYRRKKRREE